MVVRSLISLLKYNKASPPSNAQIITATTPVDDVIVMVPLPSRFQNFVTMRQEKAVVRNALLKWCSGNKCNLFVTK